MKLEFLHFLREARYAKIVSLSVALGKVGDYLKYYLMLGKFIHFANSIICLKAVKLIFQEFYNISLKTIHASFLATVP